MDQGDAAIYQRPVASEEQASDVLIQEKKETSLNSCRHGQLVLNTLCVAAGWVKPRVAAASS